MLPRAEPYSVDYDAKGYSMASEQLSVAINGLVGLDPIHKTACSLDRVWT